MLSKYIILRGKQRSDLKALLSHTLTQHTHNHFSTPVFTPIKISVSLAHATNIVAHVCLFSVEIISSLYSINFTLCRVGWNCTMYTAQTRGLVRGYPSLMIAQKMITRFHISNHFILIGADDFLRFNSLRHLHRSLLCKTGRKCTYNQRQKVLLFMIFSCFR